MPLFSFVLPAYKADYLSDSRYIKVDGKPVFAIYRSENFPNIKRSIDIWREEANKVGMELYLCRFESFATYGKTYLKSGFDAAIDFQPHFLDYTDYFSWHNFFWRIKRSIKYHLFRKKDTPVVLDYQEYYNYIRCSEGNIDYKRYPCLTPQWDNSPRRVDSKFYALINSTPEKFKYWLRSVFTSFVPYSTEENFIFINAWNEWAEGNYLEPDTRWGTQYLEAIREVIEEENK